MNEQLKKILIAAGGTVIIGGAAVGGAALNNQPCEVKFIVGEDIVCLTEKQLNAVKDEIVKENPNWLTSLGTWE